MPSPSHPFLVAVHLLAVSSLGAQTPAPVPATPERPLPGRSRAVTVPEPDVFVPLADRVGWNDPQRHHDFPDLCVDRNGQVWVVCIEHDGETDTLRLARWDGTGLTPVAAMSRPGILHQPAIATDGTGGIWCIWGQVDENDVITLRGRRFLDGAAEPEVELAASAEAGNSFADAATDPAGRLWVAWQEIRPGASRVRTRHWSPEEDRWSDAVTVSSSEGGGAWEPRLAFSDREGAWIAYDSSATGNFDLRLARVSLGGNVDDQALTETPEYEARCSISADGEGGLWIAAERGRSQWGLDSRGHENAMGLNAAKRLLLGRYDIANRTFREVPVPENGRPTPAPDPTPGFAINVPSVQARFGEVWVSYRYFSNLFWRGAVVRHVPADGSWCEPMALPESTMGQDRHQELTLAPDGRLLVCWPSDLRKTKRSGVAGVHAAIMAADEALPVASLPPAAEIARTPAPVPYRDNPTPPRPLGEHHTWTIGGKTYRLCWGDLHRHTDISNCRTGFDGCILEAYRYALDMAGLDFLGTSDHTDIAKVYDPYEWWHTQRHVDVFHAPGRFASLYAYEREQRFPWGHRNVVFARRGGPLVYINRATYRQSRWQEAYPVAPGVNEIQPAELWDILKRHGQPCAIISHTGATGMGTDWTRYDGIDPTHENLVEIFQGARVSYEAVGAPQPTVGLRAGEPYTPSGRAGDEHPAPPAPITDFDAGFPKLPGYNLGTYQTALATGHRLGVFASSDHISTHTSFGGVYVEELSREGIIDGFNSRRTCAATDKIFVEFSSGNHLMGESFSLDGPPSLTVRILGTAPLKRVTIVRNEQNHHVIEPAEDTHELAIGWTDAAPVQGENRYYLRVEQADGNMAWSSPLWIRIDR